ncbi:hypothetical protein ACHAQH_008052 [Verticillium albo-atrum]
MDTASPQDTTSTKSKAQNDAPTATSSHTQCPPSFLNAVAAPEIYRSPTALVNLWRLKAKLSNGGPFDAAADISRTVLDAVLDFASGKGLPAPHSPRAARRRRERTPQPKQQQRPPRRNHLPKGAMHETLTVTLHAGEPVGKALRRPRIPLLLPLPFRAALLRPATSLRKKQILSAAARLEAHDRDDEARVRSAMDLTMARERRIAEKE